eukprot:6474283-Alexandrium_andersonii.AAC.1
MSLVDAALMSGTVRSDGSTLRVRGSSHLVELQWLSETCTSGQMTGEPRRVWRMLLQCTRMVGALHWGGDEHRSVR